MSPTNTEEYEAKLAQGVEFQDFVTEELYKRGWVLVGHSSRKYQYERGENMMGVEIKNDARFRETGNLFIEIAEKTNANNVVYMPSGIHRNDNAIFYLIGDYSKFWVFSVKLLRMIQHRYGTRTIPTSRGWLLPVADADKYSVLSVEVVPS